MSNDQTEKQTAKSVDSIDWLSKIRAQVNTMKYCAESWSKHENFRDQSEMTRSLRNAEVAVTEIWIESLENLIKDNNEVSRGVSRCD